MQDQEAGGDSAGGGQLNDEDLDQVAGGGQAPAPVRPARSWSDVLTDADLVVPFGPGAPGDTPEA